MEQFGAMPFLNLLFEIFKKPLELSLEAGKGDEGMGIGSFDS